jgi:phosphoribosylanthranilate isomerase
MSERTRVKICGITRVEDGVAAARAGADAIGLNFWPGTIRCVQFAAARAIVDALPPFVSVVGLFVDPTADAVRAALSEIALDVLQFHGNEPEPFCAGFGRPYIKAVAVRPGVDLPYAGVIRPRRHGCSMLSSLRLPGGTGTTFDWGNVPQGLARPLILPAPQRAERASRSVRFIRGR